MPTDTAERISPPSSSTVSPVGRAPAVVIAALATGKAVRSGGVWENSFLDLRIIDFMNPPCSIGFAAS